MQPSPKIAPAELRVVADYIRRQSGIALDLTKGYLVEGRLGPLVAESGCSNYLQLFQRAMADQPNPLWNRIIDAISTNETSFYRDQGPFELLKHELLPAHMQRAEKTGAGAARTLSIWSAACSTGQEAYSIGMVVKETIADLPTWKICILGTDISETAVAKARCGRYNKADIERGLPPEKIDRYFSPAGGMWQVKDEIKALAQFKRLNLTGSLGDMGTFDIIFCRNVAIYFTPEDRARLFEQLADHLHPQGTLIIGSTESLNGITERYVCRRNGKAVFYQLRSQ